MHEKTLLAGALTMTALGATFAMYKGQTAGATLVHSVTVDLDPRDANVTIDGVPVTHPRGTFELRGALGHVFTVEVSAPLAQPMTTRIAITDIGAFPSSISLPALPSFAAPRAAMTVPPPALAVPPGVPSDFVRDLNAVPPVSPVASVAPLGAGAPGSTMGALTVVCMPRCDRIVDNGVSLGSGHIFNRPVPVGRHVLQLAASNGARKNLVVEVTAGQTKEVRESMDDARATARGNPAFPAERF